MTSQRVPPSDGRSSSKRTNPGLLATMPARLAKRSENACERSAGTSMALMATNVIGPPWSGWSVERDQPGTGDRRPGYSPAAFLRRGAFLVFSDLASPSPLPDLAASTLARSASMRSTTFEGAGASE
jgi:hypothetical protein